MTSYQAEKFSDTDSDSGMLHAIIFGDEHVSFALHSCFPLTTRRKDRWETQSMDLWQCILLAHTDDLAFIVQGDI